jgi:putative endonuclease
LTLHRDDLQDWRATARQAKEINEGRLLRRSFFAEANLPVKYVYILQSEQDAEHFYAGITDDLDAKLSKHNLREVAHTAKYRPWHIKSYVAFTDDIRAFEKYLNLNPA